MSRLIYLCASRPAAACITIALLLSASQAGAQPAGAGAPPAKPPAPAAPAGAKPTAPAAAPAKAGAPPAAPAAAPTTTTPAAAPTTPPAAPTTPPPTGAAPGTPPTATPTPEATDPTKLQPGPTAAPPAATPEPPKNAPAETPQAPADPATEKAGTEGATAGGEAEGEKKETKWYDAIDASAFVDAYFSLNLNFPRPQEATNAFRGNDIHNGFAIAQAGLDITYEADPVGATINLRFGPQAAWYAGADAPSASDSEDGPTLTLPGLEYLRQAYVTWKPNDKLVLDLGKFDTFVGAEAIDSQWNFNYTRGVVHWLAQPTFHTGLRATYTASDKFSVLGFVATGTNRSIDNNIGKTFGVQLSVTPMEELNAKVGYVGGPEQDDFLVQEFDDGTSVVLNRGSANRRWKHVADLVVTYNPSEAFGLLLNADYGRETLRPDEALEDTVDVQWLGVSLAGRYAINETFAGALRAEFYKDFDGYTTGTDLDTTLLTGTLTVEAAPAPQISIKLDVRADYGIIKAPEGSTEPAPEPFLKNAAGSSSVQPTITLGVVAKTN